MIGVEWVRMMARYNAWQNEQIMVAVRRLPAPEMTADRGAFFGSILGTLNHIVWGDMRWISRFDGGPEPQTTLKESASYFPTAGAWEAGRFQLDGRIRVWAAGLREIDLVGDLKWYSSDNDAEYRKPVGVCVTQMFNHQTHHRGQVHAMLTSIGVDPGITDLPFLPGS
ncbi:MAG: DinB family protein [Vannielia sp.]|uniref:DinB family protein n=1 Tax=Rhodobacterales TaxID=204455 RepID=UPI0020950049|nr:DinB family protein [Oceanicola sp. 502str15]MCO6381975.1 damage-inducible protein DinB [Oceanicola sp. 502str15]